MSSKQKIEHPVDLSGCSEEVAKYCDYLVVSGYCNYLKCNCLAMRELQDTLKAELEAEKAKNARLAAQVAEWEAAHNRHMNRNLELQSQADEWREKALEAENKASALDLEMDGARAHITRLRAALEGFRYEWVRFLDATKALERPHVQAKVDQARAALAETPEQSLAAITAPLEAKIERLRAALEPFLRGEKWWVDSPGVLTHNNVHVWQTGKNFSATLTYGDMRFADHVLAETPAQALEAIRAEAGRAAVLAIDPTRLAESTCDAVECELKLIADEIAKEGRAND